MVLIAGANLICVERTCFRQALIRIKASCNNKHPVEGERFGSDLIERLKTVKESNKASKQLTKYQSSSSTRCSRENDNAREPFSLLVGYSYAECKSNIVDTTNLLKTLGLYPHEDKSVTTPAQIIQHLGFVLNSTDMTVSPTEGKKAH